MGSTADGGAGHGEERTRNISSMFVTLEVLNVELNGWLNADAYYRESSGGHTIRGEMWAGWREAAGDRGARSVQARARLQIWGRARGGAHVEHAVHVRDAGGVEVQRLVERMGALPRVARRAYAAVGGAGWAGGRRRASTVHAACMGRLDCRLGAGHGEERTRNMLAMSVTLEVSKPSGWLNRPAYCRESQGGHTVRGAG